MNTDEFAENSDSSDEDYNPGGPSEVVSEVDSDGDPEDPLSDTEQVIKPGSKRKKKVRKGSNKKAHTSSYEEKDEAKSSVTPAKTEEDKKKHADSLWDMFKKDTGFKTATTVDTKTTNAELTHKTNIPSSNKKCTDKVKITQIFEFAGEEVRVEKDVPTESAEARLFSKSIAESNSGNSITISKKPASLKGIGSVLNQLGKKQKLSTLEKTKLDWDRFKKDENIEEELKAHTKGRDSYLDKQDFLERADLRRFEIEREVRAVERNKRLNNVPQ